ncbi:hypothetical protein Tco_0810138 [Tanacetum coccineum]
MVISIASERAGGARTLFLAISSIRTPLGRIRNRRPKRIACPGQIRIAGRRDMSSPKESSSESESVSDP